jgi:hypothetical protein
VLFKNLAQLPHSARAFRSDPGQLALERQNPASSSHEFPIPRQKAPASGSAFRLGQPPLRKLAGSRLGRDAKLERSDAAHAHGRQLRRDTRGARASRRAPARPPCRAPRLSGPRRVGRPRGIPGGAEGSRTPDLVNAMQRTPYRAVRGRPQVSGFVRFDAPPHAAPSGPVRRVGTLRGTLNRNAKPSGGGQGAHAGPSRPAAARSPAGRPAGSHARTSATDRRSRCGSPPDGGASTPRRPPPRSGRR